MLQIIDSINLYGSQLIDLLFRSIITFEQQNQFHQHFLSALLQLFSYPRKHYE